jgi:hypothetical protein
VLDLRLLAWLRVAPLVDLAAWGFVVGNTFRMWSQPSVVDGGIERDPQQRSIGAQAISGQLAGTITANTVVLAAVGALAAVGLQNLPRATAWHFLWAVAAALLGLSSAVWAFGTIPPRVRTRDVSRVRAVAVLTVASLAFFVIASVRLAIALWHLLRCRL